MFVLIMGYQMIKIKMDWISEIGNRSREVIMVQDKFFIVELTGKTEEPTELEALQLLNRVLDSYHKFINNPEHATMTRLKVIDVEYYWDWEKDKESGESKGSLFDYPSFNGVVGMKYFTRAHAEQLLPILKEEFGK